VAGLPLTEEGPPPPVPLLVVDVSPQPIANMLPITAIARSFLMNVLPFEETILALNHAKSPDQQRFN
jgi:hypothetical protein